MDILQRMWRDQQARSVVHESCLHLNSADWPGFLELCDVDEFQYSIVNYSPEIKRTQCWMKQDYEGLSKLLKLLPKHNSDRAALTRHAQPCRTTQQDDGGSYQVVSQFSIYRTEWDAEDSHLQSGATSLYVIGRYIDRLAYRGNRYLLTERVVDLDTRQVGIGSHHIL